jgi:Na+/proline symporter
MSDPISTPLMAKLMTGLGGLIGGVSFMAFYKPCNVWDAAVRSGLSVMTAIVFSPVLIEWLNWNPTSDNMIAASVVVGFGAWSILSFTAHTLVGLQDEKVELKLPKSVFKKQD